MQARPWTRVGNSFDDFTELFFTLNIGADKSHNYNLQYFTWLSNVLNEQECGNKQIKQQCNYV